MSLKNWEYRRLGKHVNAEELFDELEIEPIIAEE